MSDDYPNHGNDDVYQYNPSIPVEEIAYGCIYQYQDCLDLIKITRYNIVTLFCMQYFCVTTVD